MQERTFAGLVVLSFLAVAACSSVAEKQTPPPAAVRIECLPMADYSKADQQSFADEVGRLDPKQFPQVIRFLGDYKAMRDANRACRSEQG